MRVNMVCGRNTSWLMLSQFSGLLSLCGEYKAITPILRVICGTWPEDGRCLNHRRDISYK